MISLARTYCRLLILPVLIVLLDAPQASAYAAQSSTIVTGIRSQPGSPARIDTCAVRLDGDKLRLDVTLHAVDVSVATVTISFDYYNARFDFKDDMSEEWRGEPSRRIHYHSYDEAKSMTYPIRYVRYVRCEMSDVELANGTLWRQPPTYSRTDWKGNPIQ